ncbi:hypothetical protein ACH0B6_19200 [Solibacillus silvestris]
MSGGSHNYLCFKDYVELFDHGTLSDLENMAARLIELGYEGAAKETLDLKDSIQQALVRSQVMKDRLQDVWKSVEWYDSSDSGIETIEKAISNYREIKGR